MLRSLVWLCLLVYAWTKPLPHGKHHQAGTKRHANPLIHHSKKTSVGAAPKKGVVSNAHQEAIQHLNMALCANCCGGDFGEFGCSADCVGCGDCCTHDCHIHDHYHQHFLPACCFKGKTKKNGGDKQKCNEVIKQLEKLQDAMKNPNHKEKDVKLKDANLFIDTPTMTKDDAFKHGKEKAVEELKEAKEKAANARAQADEAADAKAKADKAVNEAMKSFDDVKDALGGNANSSKSEETTGADASKDITNATIEATNEANTTGENVQPEAAVHTEGQIDGHVDGQSEVHEGNGQVASHTDGQVNGHAEENVVGHPDVHIQGQTGGNMTVNTDGHSEGNSNVQNNTAGHMNGHEGYSEGHVMTPAPDHMSADEPMAAVNASQGAEGGVHPAAEVSPATPVTTDQSGTETVEPAMEGSGEPPKNLTGNIDTTEGSGEAPKNDSSPAAKEPERELTPEELEEKQKERARKGAKEAAEAVADAEKENEQAFKDLEKEKEKKLKEESIKEEEPAKENETISIAEELKATPENTTSPLTPLEEEKKAAAEASLADSETDKDNKEAKPLDSDNDTAENMDRIKAIQSKLKEQTLMKFHKQCNCCCCPEKKDVISKRSARKSHTKHSSNIHAKSKVETKAISTTQPKGNKEKIAKKDTHGCCCGGCHTCCNNCGHGCGNHCGCSMGCHTCHHPCSPCYEKWVHGNVLNGNCCCNNKDNKDCKEACKEEEGCKPEDAKCEPCQECKEEDCKQCEECKGDTSCNSASETDATKADEKKEEKKEAETKADTATNHKGNESKAAKKNVNGCCCGGCHNCCNSCGHHCGCGPGCHTCHHPCSPCHEKWVHGNVVQGNCCCNNKDNKDCKEDCKEDAKCEPCKECKEDDCKQCEECKAIASGASNTEAAKADEKKDDKKEAKKKQ